jgi:hypothetical protein
MMIRTVPERETGFICIQNCGLEHQHDAASERFGRGLSTQVKESIEITKFNLKIRPATQHMMLLSDPYSYADNIVPYTKVRGHLHRIRGRACELYMEYSISGLWNAVNNNQRVTASFTDGADSTTFVPLAKHWSMWKVERAGGCRYLHQPTPFRAALMNWIILYAKCS